MIIQSELKEILSYCPETGIFTWKVRRRGVRGNCVAGTANGPEGYIQIRINGRPYLAHRLAWLYVHGSWPADQIDHENHIRDDNRIVNLRAVSSIENSRNQTKPINNNSGVVGVNWNKKEETWKASLQVNGKRIHLGSYRNKGAARASRELAAYMYGYHENHGAEKPIYL